LQYRVAFSVRSHFIGEAHRFSGKDILVEVSLEFIADDKLVEVTPKSIRLRIRVLKANERPKK
jgi:GTP-binding protein